MSRSTIIMIIIAIVLLAAAGYLTFGKSDPTSAVSIVGAEVTRAELTFLSLTARFEPIAFDASIIRDARFSALKDIRTSIVSELSGRTDPFAPLGR